MRHMLTVGAIVLAGGLIAFPKIFTAGVQKVGATVVLAGEKLEDARLAGVRELGQSVAIAVAPAMEKQTAAIASQTAALDRQAEAIDRQAEAIGEIAKAGAKPVEVHVKVDAQGAFGRTSTYTYRARR